MQRTRAPSQTLQHAGGVVSGQPRNASPRSSPLQTAPLSSQHPFGRSTATQLAHYQLLEKVGDGTFGTVILALDKTMNNTRVALKKMKTEYRNKDEGDREREVRTLRRLRHHKNIIQLYATFFESGVFYIAYEYMERNLLDVIRGVGASGPQPQRAQQSGLPEHDVRLIMCQVFAGIDHLHRHGYFHRDMKPENILCNGSEVVKICDFGLAKEVRSSPPFTTYISTRWYRAPELLLSALNYSTPIDIWACGCIMFECYTGNPLFPGKTDIDMVHKICARLGDPKETEWPDGHKLVKKKGLKFPACAPVNLSLLFAETGGGANGGSGIDTGGGKSSISVEAITLIRNILRWNPIKRIGASQILRHAFFASLPAHLRSSQSDAVLHGSAEPVGNGSVTTSRAPTAKQQRNATEATTKPSGASRSGSGTTGAVLSAKKTSVANEKRASANNFAPSANNARAGGGAVPLRPLSPFEHSVSGVENKHDQLTSKNARHGLKSGTTQPNNSSIRSSLATTTRKSDAALATITNNRRISSGVNDTIYEYATAASDDAEAIVAAAAARHRRESKNATSQPLQLETTPPRGIGSPAATSGAVYHTTTSDAVAHYTTTSNKDAAKTLDGMTNHTSVKNNSKATTSSNNDKIPNGVRTNRTAASTYAGNNSKVLNDLFRDIDAVSDSTVVTEEARKRMQLPSAEHQGLFERSRTTSPPKPHSQQQQARQLFENLLSSADSNTKFLHDADIVKNYSNNKQAGGTNRAGRFSLDDFMPMTAPPTVNSNSASKSSLVSKTIGKNRYADFYSSMPPSLSLDGKRVSLKKSSTEFSLQNLPLTAYANNNNNNGHFHAHAELGKSSFAADFIAASSFLPPVTADPLATLNDMLLMGNNNDSGGAKSQRPVHVGSDGNLLGPQKHRHSIKPLDAVNSNGSIHQQHLTDWSRKYPQWK